MSAERARAIRHPTRAPPRGAAPERAQSWARHRRRRLHDGRCRLGPRARDHADGDAGRRQHVVRAAARITSRIESRRSTFARTTASSAFATSSTTALPRSIACSRARRPRRSSCTPAITCVSIDGAPIGSASELQERIFGSHPGSHARARGRARRRSSTTLRADADRLAASITLLTTVELRSAVVGRALRALAEAHAGRDGLVVALERDDDLIAERRRHRPRSGRRCRRRAAPR